MKNNKFWVYGKNTVFSILANQKTKVHEIQILNKNFYDQIERKYHKICNIVTEKNFLKNIKGNLIHQGIGAYIEIKPNNKIENIEGNIIILDNLYDHRNIGSIVRTAIAFEFKNIIIEKRNFSPGSQLMYKTASGAMENINFFQVSNISNAILFLKKKNYNIFAIDGSGKQSIFENTKILQTEKIAFIFGSEDNGIKQNIKKNSDLVLNIPIKNIESINVSSAVSSVLTLYKYVNKI